MHFLWRRSAFILFLLLSAIIAQAQNQPIGYWESLLPYNTALGVVTDGATLFTACDQAFFSYNTLTGDTLTYSKTNGLSDIGMQCLGYDALTSTVILAYQDGNIDLFKDNTFYNIPDLKILSVPTGKAINQVYTENGKAFICSTQGVTEINLATQSIQNTYQFLDNKLTLMPVTNFTGTDYYYYAITEKGIYRAAKSNPQINNFQVWQNIDSTDSVKGILSINDTILFYTQKKIFSFINDNKQLIYTSAYPIMNINQGNQDLFISVSINSGSGQVYELNHSFTITDSFNCGMPPAQSVQLADNSIWVACPADGLKKITGSPTYSSFVPGGPATYYCYGLYAYNNDLYIAHGGFNELYTAFFSSYGFSNLYKGQWTQNKQGVYAPIKGMYDFDAVLRDESTGIFYAASYLNGLFMLRPDGTSSVFNSDSLFDPSYAYGSGYHQLMGMALDKSHNLWVTSMFSYTQLYMMTPDSQWYKYYIPKISYGGPLIIDDNGQIWIASTSGGLVVYNTNGTPTDLTDDTTYILTQGPGNGNLPSNNVSAVAKDMDNKIWVGTDNGIGIVSNCLAPFKNQSPPCDAEIPIIKTGANSGYLLAGEVVFAIAVDGANRKWVGTLNGVWLLSPDGTNIIGYYNKDNSPLPSNSIRQITIDKVTGVVYIGTDNGLVSFHGQATNGGTSNNDVMIFPNPVRSGYNGIIAINGLVENADVRITDIDGQLVYRTTALGGQAIWNGRDYTGKRPQSGVYLVFATSSDGKQTYTGKLIFMK